MAEWLGQTKNAQTINNSYHQCFKQKRENKSFKYINHWCTNLGLAIPEFVGKIDYRESSVSTVSNSMDF